LHQSQSRRKPRRCRRGFLRLGLRSGSDLNVSLAAISRYNHGVMAGVTFATKNRKSRGAIASNRKGLSWKSQTSLSWSRRRRDNRQADAWKAANDKARELGWLVLTMDGRSRTVIGNYKRVIRLCVVSMCLWESRTRSLFLSVQTKRVIAFQYAIRASRNLFIYGDSFDGVDHPCDQTHR
jgi:hypothetical protein